MSSYDSLQTKFQRRYHRGLQFLLSYTLSDSKTNAGDSLSGGGVGGLRAPDVAGWDLAERHRSLRLPHEARVRLQRQLRSAGQGTDSRRLAHQLGAVDLQRSGADDQLLGGERIGHRLLSAARAGSRFEAPSRTSSPRSSTKAPGCARWSRTYDPEYRDLSGSLSVDFTQPWFLGPRNTLGAGVFIERRSLPGVFIRSARGGYLNIVGSISSRTTLRIGFRPELTDWNAAGNELVFCMSYIACAFDQVECSRRAALAEPDHAVVHGDRSNLAFYPTRGYICAWKPSTRRALPGPSSPISLPRAT